MENPGILFHVLCHKFMSDWISSTQNHSIIWNNLHFNCCAILRGFHSYFWESPHFSTLELNIYYSYCKYTTSSPAQLSSTSWFRLPRLRKRSLPRPSVAFEIVIPNSGFLIKLSDNHNMYTKFDVDTIIDNELIQYFRVYESKNLKIFVSPSNQPRNLFWSMITFRYSIYWMIKLACIQHTKQINSDRNIVLIKPIHKKF